MATRCWSSLPSELINHIAGRLLATADLDYYMDFRAVCHNWRAATTDPKSTLDRRFRPHNWVMLDYRSHGEGARVLVNTATGRFLVKTMPLLRDYYVVSVTADGLLVLAGRTSPHAACVLNPFTGCTVRFAAPILRNVLAAAVSASSPITLVLYCPDSRKLYSANPFSDRFVRYKKKYTYPLVRKAVLGGVSMDGDEGALPPLPSAVATKITNLMTPFIANPPDTDLGIYMSMASLKRCFLVESAGETLVVFKLENRMDVYKLDAAGNALEPVKSIGNRALFIGGFHRCLSLDADKFPSIEADCIYFIPRMNSPFVDMYHLKLKDGGQSTASASVDLPVFLSESDDALVAHPMTIIQLLLIYSFNFEAMQVTQDLEQEERLMEKLLGAFQNAF